MSQTLPTYEELINKIHEYLNSSNAIIGGMGMNVFVWMSEYSETNHSRMMIIVSKLLSIQADYYDEDFEVPADDKKAIFNIGLDIHNEGGFTAQQACFYIVRNFVEPTNKRTKAIEICWNGAGEWVY